MTEVDISIISIAFNFEIATDTSCIYVIFLAFYEVHIDTKMRMIHLDPENALIRTYSLGNKQVPLYIYIYQSCSGSALIGHGNHGRYVYCQKLRWPCHVTF